MCIYVCIYIYMYIYIYIYSDVETASNTGHCPINLVNVW